MLFRPVRLRVLTSTESSPTEASMRLWMMIAVVWAMLLSSATAAAEPSDDCKSPRAAIDSVFRWQLRGQQDLHRASVCLERTGRSSTSLDQSAQRIKMVFDAHGAWVVMEELSDDPNFEDESRRFVARPHSKLPDIVVEKKGDVWLWTKPSLDRVDAYYADVALLVRVAGNLPAVFHDVQLLGVKLWQYLALILMVVLGLVVRKVIAAFVAPRLKRLAERLRSKWPERIVDVIASPGATLLTAILLRLGYPQLLLPVAWSRALSSTVQVLITISILWAVYRAVDVLAARLTESANATESKLDGQLVPLVRKTLKVVVFVIGTLVVLQNLHFDVTTLFASVSIGGLVIGLAAKDTLANLFGSISIFVDTPFQIGDWINVEGVDGTVEEVGFRSTRIRTFYNSVVVLPNAKVADTKIDNFGQREFRRCFTKVGLTYDTTPEQMQAFVEGVRAIIVANEYTRKDVFEVHMSGFGDSSLDVMLYFFFACETWSDELRERHNIFLEVMRLARELRVDFAFPTQTLHVEAMATASDRRPAEPPPPKRLRDVVHGFGPDGELKRPGGPKITKSGYVPKPSARGVDDGDG